MKISINSQFLDGPYGGGMQFANYLKKYLEDKGLTVINNLNDEEIDIILHINPFSFLTPDASSYSFFDAYIYKLRHPKTVIIERVNEGDARKGTSYMDKLLVKACNYSDFVIFIASWLKPNLEQAGLDTNKANTVILNGADRNIFNTSGKEFWDGKSKMKIVTHHWSNNPSKGHDIYQYLDLLMGEDDLKDLFEFTYIGKIPPTSEYKNTKLIAPLSSKALADELRKHDVYITASKNEPAGMHHIEAALCGLPILYINSGALPEYCSDFGLEFDKTNLRQKVKEIRERYEEFKARLDHYDKTAERMAGQYLEVIKSLYGNREEYQIIPNIPLILWLEIYKRFFALRFTIFRKLGII